eukprot:691024-Pleurochrysis_carterae.AAC.1
MHDVSVWQTVLSSSEDSHADSQQLLPHHAPSSSVAAPPAPEKLSTTLYCHVRDARPAASRVRGVARG